MSKISELSDGGVIQGGDTLIAVRSGGNVKVTYGGSTTANIDGGTIDGTVIGGSSAAAGTFTTLTASGVSTLASTVQITNGALNLSPTGTANAIVNAGASMFINIDSDNNNAGESFYISRDAANTTGARVAKFDAIGDISFYEDTGTTAKFFWDASAESLGIGTSSPDRQLVINNASSFAGLKLTEGVASTDVRLTASDSGAGLFGTWSNHPLALYTNGSERARIDSAGNVGIGTSAPATALHVNSGAENVVARFESTDTATAIEFKDSTGTVTLETRNDFRFKSGTTINAIIDSSGNVGIGTSSPDANLHISGTGNDAKIILEGVANPRGNFIACEGADDLVFAADEDNLGADSAMKFRIDATERMRIDSSGNVGIGTSSPSTTAASAGAVVVDLKGDAINRGGIVNYRTSDNSKIGWVGLDAGLMKLGTETAHDSVFYTSNTERARLDSSGNLLIGTSTAGASKLVVNDDSIQVNTAKTPASASDTGTTGEIAWDANYVYVCVATNTWKRSALSTW